MVGFEKALGAVKMIKDQIQYRSQSLLNLARGYFRAWLNGNAMFYETFTCFYVSEAKPLCFSLCSQMFDDVE